MSYVMGRRIASVLHVQMLLTSVAVGELHELSDADMFLCVYTGLRCMGRRIIIVSCLFPISFTTDEDLVQHSHPVCRVIALSL